MNDLRLCLQENQREHTTRRREALTPRNSCFYSSQSAIQRTKGTASQWGWVLMETLSTTKSQSMCGVRAGTKQTKHRVKHKINNKKKDVYLFCFVKKIVTDVDTAKRKQNKLGMQLSKYCLICRRRTLTVCIMRGGGA